MSSEVGGTRSAITDSDFDLELVGCLFKGDDKGGQMRTSVKWNLVILALVVGVACATGAYAQEFSWSLSSLPGVGVSGSGTGEATNEGGTYLVTAFTGSISIPGSSGAAISFVSCTSGSTCIDPTGQYQYDDLLFPSNTPELDEYGLVFSATGLADMNLCGTYGCANVNGYDKQ